MAYVDYNNKFQQNEIRATQKYALGLPSGPVNYHNTIPNAPHAVWGGAGPLVQGPRYQRRVSGLLQYDWGANHPTGGGERVQLYKVTHQHLIHHHGPMGHVFAAPQNTQAEGAVLLEFTAAPNGFDAYYLPWTPRGGVIYMTLPAGGGPRHFFTAALSGCSVMIVGPTHSPTVYHCGVDTWGLASPYTQAPYAQAGDPPAPDSRFTHELWVDLVAHVANTPMAVFEKQSTVDKRHYINDFAMANQQTTAGSRALELTLRQRTHDPHATANPFGSVFGLKDNAGNWSFYLQANVNMMSGAHPNQRRVCRPVEIIQFYPYWKTIARIWHF